MKTTLSNYNITDKELEIFELIATSQKYREIADSKNITLDSVKKHASRVYKKLNVRNKTEALLMLKGLK